MNVTEKKLKHPTDDRVASRNREIRPGVIYALIPITNCYIRSISLLTLSQMTVICEGSDSNDNVGAVGFGARLRRGPQRDIEHQRAVVR